MLRPLTAAREAAALETSWALAQSPATSLYPSFADGIKTREEFLRAASLRNAAPGEALAHLSDGEIQGLIRYEALPEGRLLTFSAFAARNPARATAEFLAYAAARYPGWQVDFGLHGENAGPRSVLEKAGWTRTEECRVCVCPLAGNISPSLAENVEPVTPRTFSEFAHLHHRTAGMYWNSPRLRAAYFRENTPWRLTLYRRQGRAAAALCWQRFGDLAEIFGVDFEGEFDGEAMAPLLAQSLAEARRTGARAMYFFCDTAPQARAAQAAGMGLFGRYQLYQGALPPAFAKP